MMGVTMTVRGTANLPATEDLVGRPVYDENDEKIGTVAGLYLDATDGEATYLAVESGWFGTRRHVIPLDDVTARGTDPDKDIILPYSRETLSSAPTFGEHDDLTLRDESEVHEHYGLESYQNILDARQTAPAPTPEIAEAEMQAAVRRGDDPSNVRTKRWGV
jgi:sporulation protein YlmC with PRC-barrel domain